MKKKPKFFAVVITLALVALLARWWLQRNGSSVEQFDGSTRTGSSASIKPVQVSSKDVEPTRINEAPKADVRLPEVIEKPLYELAETKSSFDPVADAKRREDLPFRMFASGGIGKVVDAAGNVIVQSDANSGIFGCEASPNHKRIVVYRGDADYDVITLSTGDTIRLPQQPPGGNVLGFSWHWIDDQTLVGVSGITIPFRAGQVGPEREEPNISQSTLYVYKISEHKLAEVELPTALRSKIFSVNAVDPSGKVQLRPEDHDSYTDASLEWFDVRPKK